MCLSSCFATVFFGSAQIYLGMYPLYPNVLFGWLLELTLRKIITCCLFSSKEYFLKKYGKDETMYFGRESQKEHRKDKCLHLATLS